MGSFSISIMARKSKKAESDGQKQPKPKEEAAVQKEAVNKDITKIQPAINIGLVGHVDHGKTTLVKAFSGKWTDTHSEELKRGITIRLGYADAGFYRCRKCEGVDAYGVSPKCAKCGGDAELVRKVSFVDAPGHESLMATMLAGATIMDGALLLIAANEECPQPQTREHLMALEIIGVEKVIIVQNKIDLVTEEQAEKSCKQIKAFIKGTKYENAPIIPICGQHSVNLDALIYTIESVIPTPKRDPSKEPLFVVARSFDINKPGTDGDKMMGGVLGGSLKQGMLKVGDSIEILPGYEKMIKNQATWIPLKTKIAGIMTGGEKVNEILPGGSVGIMTELDPSIVKSDKLTGAAVGYEGKIPPVWNNLALEIHLLERVVGAKDKLVVSPVKMSEILMLNVNSAATVGFVTELKKGIVKCRLKRPVCAAIGSRVTISRRVGNRWRLIGYGSIKQL
jgi:translation initiation factor 2 subunit 3